jgi:hypothetical protein
MIDVAEIRAHAEAHHVHVYRGVGNGTTDVERWRGLVTEGLVAVGRVRARVMPMNVTSCTCPWCLHPPSVGEGIYKGRVVR